MAPLLLDETDPDHDATTTTMPALVQNDQNAWYNNGTQKKKNSEKMILTNEKEINRVIRSPTLAQP